MSIIQLHDGRRTPFIAYCRERCRPGKRKWVVHLFTHSDDVLLATAINGKEARALAFRFGEERGVRVLGEGAQ